MFRISWWMLLACLIAPAGGPSAGAKEPQESPSPASPPATGPAGEVALDDFVIGKPIICRNLTVFPVASKTPRTEDPYLTLDEGLKSKLVEVYEVGAEPGAAEAPAPSSARQTASPSNVQQESAPVQMPAGYYGDVNHLVVINRSKKPLYLMPGEIIYGGKQDRCVGEECLIAPDQKPVKIGVFCVEQGRWSARGGSQTVQELHVLAENSGGTADRRTLHRLAQETQRGKFVAPAGSLDKKGRQAVQEGKGQGQVWSNVSRTNVASGASNASSAFTANYTRPDTSKKLQVYLKELQAPVDGHSQVVGAIVAVNGKVEAVDVFQSTPLFRKLWPKLLQSHALDAVAAGKPKTKTVCTVQDAAKFLDDAMHGGKEEKSKTKGGLAVSKRDSERVSSFSVAAPSRSAQGGKGGFGKDVHSSGYSK
ncbi:MAG: hypothetical protein JXB10_19535 [Pirellulales bacterium]|nr:hypothetical protein [Pirellulales bacterium]